MELALVVTALTSAFAAVIVLKVTRSRILMCLAFDFAPLLSLSFWVVSRLVGIGPSNFIPNWVAGVMVIFPFSFWILWSWATEEYKEEQ